MHNDLISIQGRTDQRSKRIFFLLRSQFSCLTDTSRQFFYQDLNNLFNYSPRLSHRNIRTQAATMEYARRVPMLIILTSWPSSKIAPRIPVSSPAENVPASGVWNRGLTVPIHLNISPSEAMAYITRGSGNIAPSKLECE